VDGEIFQVSEEPSGSFDMRKPGDSYTPKDGDELVAFMKALCSKCDKDDVEGCWIIEDFREPVCEGDE